LLVCRSLWLLANYTKEFQSLRVGFAVASRATFFHFQPLLSIKRPSNATGRVLFVLISMLSVHLWWWFGLFLWFLLSCPPAGRSRRCFASSRSHLFSRFSPRCQPLFSIKRLTNPTGASVDCRGVYAERVCVVVVACVVKWLRVW
jgi:hypothetical protein